MHKSLDVLPTWAQAAGGMLAFGAAGYGAWRLCQQWQVRCLHPRIYRYNKISSLPCASFPSVPVVCGTVTGPGVAQGYFCFSEAPVREAVTLSELTLVCRSPLFSVTCQQTKLASS